MCFLQWTSYPHYPQPCSMQCVLLPWPPHDGIQVVRPCTLSTCYRTAQTARGAPDVAWEVANRGEQSVPSPYFPLTTLLPPVELYDTATDGRRRWCSGSSFAVSGMAAKEHSPRNRSQPVRLKNHIITNLRSYIYLYSTFGFLKYSSYSFYTNISTNVNKLLVFERSSVRSKQHFHRSSVQSESCRKPVIQTELPANEKYFQIYWKYCFFISRLTNFGQQVFAFKK